MKQSSNGSQRTLSTTVTAKATSPEGRAAGLYSKREGGRVERGKEISLESNAHLHAWPVVWQVI